AGRSRLRFHQARAASCCPVCRGPPTKPCWRTRNAVAQDSPTTGDTWKYQLQGNGTYARRDHSPAFPFLPLESIRGFLDRRNATDETTWIRSFRKWVRTLVLSPSLPQPSH